MIMEIRPSSSARPGGLTNIRRPWLAGAGYGPASPEGRAASSGVMAAMSFTERHNALLAEQETGLCACYVLVGEDGSVLGRFNLYDIQDGTAELGYRVAQHVAGRGVATAAVRELCQLAAAPR